MKHTARATGAATLSRLFRGSHLDARPPEPPNILFVLDDQLRQDVGKFVPMPNCERLGRECITFRHAISTTPLCTPFRGMLMTGRYPMNSGVLINGVNVSPAHNPDCLAQVFSRAGYDTGFIGKWHLASGVRTAAGLYQFHPAEAAAWMKQHPNSEFVPPGPDRLGFSFWQAYNFHMDFNHYWYYENEPKKIYSQKYTTDTNIDQAIDFIEKRKKPDKPFLLVVAPHPPHPPFTLESLPSGYLEKIPPATDLFRPPNVPSTNNPMKPEEWRIYLAMAKNFDDNLGRLLDYLDRSPAGENTLLVLTADHGEMAGSHGGEGKMVPYAESVNIPLKMRWPGYIPAGVTSDALYTPVDHLTTLCGLAGVQPPREADGRNLSEVVLGLGESRRDAVLMANYSSEPAFFQTGTTFPEWRAVRTTRYTYVKWLAGPEALFDNAEDPYQMRNLIKEDRALATVTEFRRRLKDLLASANDQFLPGDRYGAWYDANRNLIKN